MRLTLFFSVRQTANKYPTGLKLKSLEKDLSFSLKSLKYFVWERVKPLPNNTDFSQP